MPSTLSPIQPIKALDDIIEHFDLDRNPEHPLLPEEQSILKKIKFYTKLKFFSFALVMGSIGTLILSLSALFFILFFIIAAVSLAFFGEQKIKQIIKLQNLKTKAQKELWQYFYNKEGLIALFDMVKDFKGIFINTTYEVEFKNMYSFLQNGHKEEFYNAVDTIISNYHYSLENDTPISPAKEIADNEIMKEAENILTEVFKINNNTNNKGSDAKISHDLSINSTPQPTKYMYAK